MYFIIFLPKAKAIDGKYYTPSCSSTRWVHWWYSWGQAGIISVRICQLVHFKVRRYFSCTYKSRWHNTYRKRELQICNQIFQFQKDVSVRIYLQLFVGGLTSYLRYLCLLANSGVQHILCCVFVLFVFVLLPVSLVCPFFIAP